ncbi:MAG: hypothetical protein BGO14_07810 [Chlamydiales bacterium 38-26]|nr:hypothetical protein [Chlamydiales bacterium]OJV10903.1 MAG: hypothetical protein BGO14_07810 [Chlamydiales bacterium 38-26]
MVNSANELSRGSFSASEVSISEKSSPSVSSLKSQSSNREERTSSIAKEAFQSQDTEKAVLKAKPLPLKKAKKSLRDVSKRVAKFIKKPLTQLAQSKAAGKMKDGAKGVKRGVVNAAGAIKSGTLTALTAIKNAAKSSVKFTKKKTKAAYKKTKETLKAAKKSQPVKAGENREVSGDLRLERSRSASGSSLEASSSERGSSSKSIRDSVSMTQWIENTCPEIKEDFSHAKAILKQSEDSKALLKTRMDCMPIKSSSGLSGCYFIQGMKGDPPEFPADIHQLYAPQSMEKKFIVKPTIQEPGARGNPSGINARGIASGKGAIRERMGYTAQTALGLNLGIPPTALAKMEHSLFGIPKEVDQHLSELSNSLGMRLTRQEFYHLMGPHLDIHKFKQNVAELKKNELIKVLDLDLSNEVDLEFYTKIQDFVEEMGQKIVNNEEAKLPQELLDLVEEQQEVVGSYMKALAELKYSKDVDQKIQEIDHQLHEVKKGDSQLVSLQKFVDNVIPMQKMIKAKTIDRICPKEFEKFSVDLILLNTDRHMGNALVKQTPKNEVISSLEQAGLNRDSLENALKELKNNSPDYQKAVHDFLSSLPDHLQNESKIEQNLHGLFYAESKNLSDVYEVVLIDHGSCLPDPEEDIVGLGSAVFLWAELPQAAKPISGLAKQKILSLNPEDYIEKIQSDQVNHAKQFGVDCEIGEGCYKLMKLSILGLQKLVELDKPLTLAKRFAKAKVERNGNKIGGELSTIYKNFIRNNPDPDWTKINEEIIKAFSY